MIEKKLNDKIEDTVAGAITQEALFEDAGIDPVPESPEPAPPVFAEDPNPAIGEAVEVAGLGSIARSALDGLKKRTAEAERRVTMGMGEPPPVQEIGTALVIREADPDEVQAINQQLGGTYTKGLNYPDIFESTGDFDAAQYMAQFKDANAELFEQARRGTIKFDQMLEMAKKRGLDSIVYDLTKRQPGDVLPPEEFLAGMLAYEELMKQARKGWADAFNMPQGVEREVAMSKALQISTVHAHVTANLSGAVSEAARTVQLSGELKRRGIPQVNEEVALFGAKTVQDIEHAGRYYLAITDPNAMTRFLQKGLASKSMDVITEVWINSILTLPVTHMVNIAGNASFMGLRNLETYVAAGFGSARSAVTGSRDKVRVREGLAQLEGMRKALGDAFIVAGKVAVTETPSDLASKIDVRSRRAIGNTGDPRIVFEQIKSRNLMSAAVNGYGIFARLGGRALLVEDEFFKAIGGRSELYRIAEMRAANLYDQTIATGGTVDQAKQAYAAERARIIENPSEETKRTAQQAARDMTFQGDLDGFLGDMQGAMSHPIAKLFVPFFRTPMNIMRETLERSPVMLVYPGFYKKIAAGGREADIAMSKLAVGSAIMSSFAYASFGLDDEEKSVRIIGGGPSDKNARAAMMRQGFQPYSINIKQDDGTYKSITFSRFDPISGVLAMAADFAYYAQYETDQATLDQLAMAASVGVAEYMMDMPLLQGMSEIQGALAQPTGAEKFDALLGLLSEKGTSAALSLIPGTGSFTAGVARVRDPTARSTLLPEEGMFGEDPTQLPAVGRGFYTALQKAKARNPFFSKDLPPALNEWGEVMTTGEGVWWEFWSPVRIKNTKYSAVDEEFMTLGGGISRTPRKIDGVLLNNEQYNIWIKTTNELDRFGRLPGQPNYDASTTMILELERAIIDPMYQELPTKADKLDMLKNIVAQRRSAARRIMLDQDISLRAKVNAVQ